MNDFSSQNFGDLVKQKSVGQHKDTGQKRTHQQMMQENNQINNTDDELNLATQNPKATTDFKTGLNLAD